MRLNVDKMYMSYHVNNKHFCRLAVDGLDAGIVSNELFEALAYFDKEIVIFSHVSHVDLSNIGLTSLVTRFTSSRVDFGK